MGEVIDFPKSKKQNKVVLKIDKQLLLEMAIVQLWERSKGLDLVVGVPEYHIIFLQFADICFRLMTDRKIVVSEDGSIELTDDATKSLIEFVKRKET